jgi:type IV secretory pathway VirB10-like protein
VLEAGFLVLLAVVVGLADFDPLLIVLVMLVGWILVSLIEYLAWRQSQSAMMRGFEPAFAGVSVNEMVADDTPPPPPPPPAPPPTPPPPPPDEDTVVEPPRAEEEHVEEPNEEAVEEPPAPEEPSAPEEPDAPVEDSEAIAFATAEEQRIAHRLDPLKPRPRHRWLFFGPHARQEKPAEDDNEA